MTTQDETGLREAVLGLIHANVYDLGDRRRTMEVVGQEFDAAREGLDVEQVNKALQATIWTMGASARIPVELRQEFVDMGIRLFHAEYAVLSPEPES